MMNTPASGARLLSPPWDVRVVRWLMRLASGALFLFWGAFFLEHLAWFSAQPNFPPPSVWLLQALHLLLLVGYLLIFKWERLGSLLSAVNASLFFAATAGPNFWAFLWLALVPAGLCLYLWLRHALANPTIAHGQTR